MQTYEININGCSLKLKTEHEQQNVDAIKTLVEEKVKNTLDKYPNLPMPKALLLTCLHFAESQFLFKEIFNEKFQNLESQAQEILEHIEDTSSSGIRAEESRL